MSLVQHVSRETVINDPEGFFLTCESGGCTYEGTLIALDWDTPDWANIVCPQCFTSHWVRAYE